MKKKTQAWIKETLIAYLNEHQLTIKGSNWGYKLGINSQGYNFKSHYDTDIDNYIQTKFHLQCEEEETKKFFSYLWEKRSGNEDMVLEFFKTKSPANKTKVNKEGIVKIEDSSNEHYSYQKYIISLVTDEDMLFDYIGNLRFLGGEQSLSFELIKNVFSKEKQECLIEMYLNSNLLKNVEFERKMYQLVSDLHITDKYLNYFPNLKKGKKDFSLQEFENKKTESFIINFDKDTLVKLIEVDKTMDTIFSNINNIVNLAKIPELNIELINVISDKNTKKIIMSGDNLNIDYLKVAISEYMRIVLKEEKNTQVMNNFVYAKTDFDTDNGRWNNEYKLAFVDFKERIAKIQFKEMLDRKLVKEEVKMKPRKI